MEKSCKWQPSFKLTAKSRVDIRKSCRSPAKITCLQALVTTDALGRFACSAVKPFSAVLLGKGLTVPLPILTTGLTILTVLLLILTVGLLIDESYWSTLINWFCYPFHVGAGLESVDNVTTETCGGNMSNWYMRHAESWPCGTSEYVKFQYKSCTPP